MHVKDYLLKFIDDDEALTAANQWVITDEEGQPLLNTPIWQSASKVIAYEELPIPATLDEEGAELTSGTPAIISSSVWWIITMEASEELPNTLTSYVVSSGLRSDGLSLPAEIKGFESLLAGIKTI